MHTREEKYARFLELGWEKSQQSDAVFNFLHAAAMEAGPDDVIVDLGAGQCRYKFFFEHARYIAVDFGLGDDRWDYSQLDVLGDITRLDFLKDNSVDFCLSTVTLEHLNDPQTFFDNTLRILKPGGKLFLYVPFVSYEHQQPYDFYRYTSFGLRHLASAYEQVTVTPSNDFMETAASMLRLAFQHYRFVDEDSRVAKEMLECKDLMESRLFPLMRRLSTAGESAIGAFPICWLMTAAKPGERPPSPEFSNTQQVLQKIIRCPSCEKRLLLQEKDCTCMACGKKYPRINGILNVTPHGALHL